MLLHAASLAASVPVLRVPARVPAFHVRVRVQVEVLAKNELPAKCPSTTEGSSGTLHLPW